MKHALALLLLSCVLVAQDKAASPDPAGLQPITNPKDERLNVFRELEAKAALDDKKALAEIGRYYCDGRFPVLRNIEKAKAYLIRGATLGDAECAGIMSNDVFFISDQTDSVRIIENQKWRLIYSSLRRIRSEHVPRPSYVSEATWSEAKARAADFLATVKLGDEKPAPAKPKPKKGGR